MVKLGGVNCTSTLVWHKHKIRKCYYYTLNVVLFYKSYIGQCSQWENRHYMVMIYSCNHPLTLATEMMRCAMRLATICLTHQIKIRNPVTVWVQIMYGDISHFSHAAVEPRDKIWEWPGNEAMVTYGWTINEPHLPKMTVKYLALQKRNVGLSKMNLMISRFVILCLCQTRGGTLTISCIIEWTCTWARCLLASFPGSPCVQSDRKLGGTWERG